MDERLKKILRDLEFLRTQMNVSDDMILQAWEFLKDQDHKDIDDLFQLSAFNPSNLNSKLNVAMAVVSAKILSGQKS